jgi:hypothetical protein
METLVKIIQAIAPLVTVGLAVFGLFVWYWQLVAKRKFEIAEQAITVWRLIHVRNPFVYGGEGDSINIDSSFVGKKRQNAERHRYVYERLRNISDAFQQVRLTQILVDLHISNMAAQSFDALFRVRHLVQVDASMLIDDFDECIEEVPAQTPDDVQRRKEYLERRRDYRRGITERRDKDGKPHEDDKYSQVLDEAKEVLESECRQILRPKTLREFLFTRPVQPRPHEWSPEAKKVMMIRS